MADQNFINLDAIDVISLRVSAAIGMLEIIAGATGHDRIDTPSASVISDAVDGVAALLKEAQGAVGKIMQPQA